MPTPPLTREAINETFVCVLKSMFLTNTVRCMIEQELIKESTQFTVVSRLNQGKSYPLLFVHYSGYNYVELLRGNIVQNNILGLKNYPDIMHLVLTYAEAIKAQNAIFNRFINQLIMRKLEEVLCRWNKSGQ